MNALGIKGRAIEFSTLQRASAMMASRTDIDEASMVSGAAVRAADQGESEKMIIIERISNDPYMVNAKSQDVQEIANQEKMIPLEWINQDDFTITDDFINYAKPLIHGSYPAIMVDGLPRHLALDWQKMKEESMKKNI